MGETIAVGSTQGYLATPDMGAGPAVIVITEPASSGHGRRVADILAAEGFTALAPEVRSGETAGDLGAALDFLRPHPAVRGHGVGVVGFARGAGLALWLGAHRPDDVTAVVLFYGVIPEGAEQSDWSRLSAAVEGHYGEDDPACPPDRSCVCQRRRNCTKDRSASGPRPPSRNGAMACALSRARCSSPASSMCASTKGT